ncbi:MAG TPA: hypothetical protein VGG42_07760 [Acidobacteriaceae bacterium]|jgi:sialate O-acetylesterase
MTTPKPLRSFTSCGASRTCLTLAIAALALALPPQSFAQAQCRVSPAISQHDAQRAGEQGPTLSSSEIAQGAILLHFAHAEGGLCLKDRGRGTFQIAGADHHWFPADAHLVNGVVVVSTSLVQQPTAVRYSWQDRAAATLFNSAGQPAAPFRTDE